MRHCAPDHPLIALGKDFIIGCAILAAGVVAAGFISKKK